MSKSSNRKPPAAHLAVRVPAVTAADTAPVAVTAVLAAKAAPVDLAGPADAPAASANTSARKKSANSASRNQARPQHRAHALRRQRLRHARSAPGNRRWRRARARDASRSRAARSARGACSPRAGATSNRSAQDLIFWSAGAQLPLLGCEHGSILKRSTATAATAHVAAADFRGHIRCRGRASARPASPRSRFRNRSK